MNRFKLSTLVLALFAVPALAQPTASYEFRRGLPALQVAPAQTQSPAPPLTREAGLTSRSLAFGTRALGSSTTASVSLLNTGTGALSLSPVQITGANFSATTNCPASLAAGASCDATAVFSPSSLGPAEGTLDFITDATNGPFRVTLGGSAEYASSGLGTFQVTAKTFGDSAFTLTPPSSLNTGAWTYSSSNPLVATVSGNQVTIVGAGSATLSASQEASGVYGPAQLSATLEVAKAAPSIATWTTSLNGAAGSTASLTPPASNSTGTWTYVSSNPAVATVSGTTLNRVAAGTTLITATQAATQNHLEGSVQQTVTVATAALPKTCNDIKLANPGSADGIYAIYPTGSAPSINVYCDMTTAGGGWTMLSRWTNWPSGSLSQGTVMVRGSAFAGTSNSAATYPAYTGPNQFAELRYDSANSTWNTLYGVSATAGIKFPTWSAWPTLTSSAQMQVGATTLAGGTSAALATVALGGANWWGYGGDASSFAFSLFTVSNNTGICGGANRVGSNKICGITSYVSGNAHYDLTSVKVLWGR